MSLFSDQLLEEHTRGKTRNLFLLLTAESGMIRYPLKKIERLTYPDLMDVTAKKNSIDDYYPFCSSEKDTNKATRTTLVA